MNILTRIIVVLTLSLTVFALPARAENLALVLSFENYDHGRDANGALSHHDALLAAYRAAGFRAISGRDRTEAQLKNRIEAFMEQLNGADKVVIHISGHVVHFGQSSWVLPSDIQIRSVADVEASGTSLEFLLQLLAVKRNNAVMFAGSAGRGFAAVPGVSSGVSLIGVPDGVMLVHGSINDVNRAVLNDFLSSGKSVVTAMGDNSRRLDNIGNLPRGFTLSANPFQDDINRENAMNLSRTQRRSIQTDLATMGFSVGIVDGVFGSRTRTAVRNWQQREGRRVTGYLNAGQINAIHRQAEEENTGNDLADRAYWNRTGGLGTESGLRAYLRRYPSGLYAGRARWELDNMDSPVSEDDDWREAARVNTFQSYSAYLHDYPDGIYRDIANQRIRALGGIIDDSGMGDDAEPRLAEARLNLNSISRILIETRLGDMGYEVGPKDGVLDAQARRAIARYQRDRGMEVHGYVSSDMIRRLLLNL